MSKTAALDIIEMHENVKAAAVAMLALGRKVEIEDLTPVLTSMAAHYAATYEGSFEYMLSMRQAVYAKRTLSPAMSKGILNCLRAELIRLPGLAEEAAQAQAHAQAAGMAAPEPKPAQAPKSTHHRKTYTEMAQSPWQKDTGSKAMAFLRAPRQMPADVAAEQDLFGPKWSAWKAQQQETFKSLLEQDKQAHMRGEGLSHSPPLEAAQDFASSA